MRTVCIMQTRMGSTRLPGKILMPVLDRPVLWWQMYRMQKIRYLDEIVVATTTRPRDDVIIDLCEREGWAYFRGDEVDVLDRYYQAARQFEAECILRITSDCPLIEPSLCDQVITTFQNLIPRPDYVSLWDPPTYPKGLDSEALRFDALERAWQEDKTPESREHVAEYMLDNPEIFRLHFITNPLNLSHHRWTLDYPEDLEFTRRIYEHFGHGDFSWHDVLAALDAHPDWVEINAHLGMS